MHAGVLLQVLSELLQFQSLRFLDPIGSLLDECTVDEASAAAASPAFMSGAVLLPFMDILMCQVCVCVCGCDALRQSCRNSAADLVTVFGRRCA
jgi:hypothetical protein